MTAVKVHAGTRTCILLDVVVSLFGGNVLRRRVRVHALGATASKLRVVFRGTRNFASQLFEGLSLGLWNQKRGEATQKHEEGEDLEDVVEPGRCAGAGSAGGTAGSEGSDGSLGDDGTDLSRGGGDTVAGGSVASGEALARDLQKVSR